MYKQASSSWLPWLDGNTYTRLLLKQSVHMPVSSSLITTVSWKHHLSQMLLSSSGLPVGVVVIGLPGLRAPVLGSDPRARQSSAGCPGAGSDGGDGQLSCLCDLSQVFVFNALPSRLFQRLTVVFFKCFAIKAFPALDTTCSDARR